MDAWILVWVIVEFNLSLVSLFCVSATHLARLFLVAFFFLADVWILAPGCLGGGEEPNDFLFFLPVTIFVGVVVGEENAAENFAFGSIFKYVDSLIPSETIKARDSANVIFWPMATLNSL